MCTRATCPLFWSEGGTDVFSFFGAWAQATLKILPKFGRAVPCVFFRVFGAAAKHTGARTVCVETSAHFADTYFYTYVPV